MVYTIFPIEVDNFILQLFIKIEHISVNLLSLLTNSK